MRLKSRATRMFPPQAVPQMKRHFSYVQKKRPAARQILRVTGSPACPVTRLTMRDLSRVPPASRVARVVMPPASVAFCFKQEYLAMFVYGSFCRLPKRCAVQREVACRHAHPRRFLARPAPRRIALMPAALRFTPAVVAEGTRERQCC